MIARWCLVVFSCAALAYLSHAVPTSNNRAEAAGPAVTGTFRSKRWPVDCPVAGCKGEKGARGDVGPSGPRGYRGTVGPPGFCDGRLCLEFVRTHLPTPSPVPQGDPGQTGPPGPQGQQGAPGEAGLPGPPGAAGNDGTPGLPGASGEKGDAGRKGFPGVMGPPGEKGVSGEAGRKGVPGAPGDPGLPGEDGIPGRMGLPGKLGLPGDNGTPGQQGRNGADGAKGERGPPGPPIEVIAREDSETCTRTLQGVIRFDPNSGQLYYCNGTQWVCIETLLNCGRPTCPSPFGRQNVGDQWYQVFTDNVTRSTQDAADIVLVIDDSGSMNREHEWLLVMVPSLEQILIDAGVGDGAVRNRYCAVAFGGFLELEPGHFLPVNGQSCFTAAEFSQARVQLANAGLREDGYEALKFALDNVPFRRNNPFVAKNMILITDEGRNVIPQGENITRQSIEAELRRNGVLLNVVVQANYQLVDRPNETVIGVDSRRISYILEPGGEFGTSNSSFEIVQAHGDTAETYVDLALALGGAAWALPVLRESSTTRNVDLQQSFTSALTQIKLREIRASIESCRRCTCVAGPDETRGIPDCVAALNEEFCQCVVQNGGNEALCSSNTPTPNPGPPGGEGIVRAGNIRDVVDRIRGG